MTFILPNADGTFEPLSEREPGAIAAQFLRVTVDAKWLDTIAWDPGTPSIWWTRRRVVPFIGSDELSRAWWDERPARFVATPADYLLHRKNAVCIIDWTADINSIIGVVDAVTCETRALAEKMKQTLLRQSRPKIINNIFVRDERRAA